MKILFIGNIANNAYLLAKFLREKGVEADVLCYNYYDIMSCPEWEDAEIRGDWIFNERPEWFNCEIRNFKRPKWLIQGPLDVAVSYLLEPNPKSKLSLDRHCFIEHPHFNEGILPFWRPSEWKVAFNVDPVMAALALPYFFFKCLTISLKRKLPADLTETRDLNLKNKRPADAFFSEFRTSWSKLFDSYDFVQAHATDPIWPMLYSNKPYVAFEHGTLRNIPFEDGFIGELTRLAYKKANHVIITNTDNIAAAEKLKIQKFSFLPHPVNPVCASDEDAALLRNDLIEKLDSNYIVFHPSRQHWDEKVRHPDWEKGNDIFIKGFAKFAKEINPKAGAVFVEWGQKLKETKALLAELDIADRITWVKPLPHIEMTKYIKACDMVADQFWIGAFGAITPKAMMCGRAVLLKLDEGIHKLAFPELPPVLNAKNPEDVFLCLKKHYEDNAFRHEIEQKSSDWFHKYHSAPVITDKLLNVYEELLEESSVTKR